MENRPQIRMIASLAGEKIAYGPGDVLTVGVDVSEEQAIAFCSLFGEPEARAEPANDAMRRLLGLPTAEPEKEEKVDDEPRNEGSPEHERATAPEQDKRETTEQPRRRARPTPPRPAPKKEEEPSE